MSLPERPITILIAALGGEGGGVMADWLMEAATESDLPAQATSIPGVAQRTGATTYYLEIYPARKAELGGREPVLSLTPSPGNVDIMVASELVEAGRAMQNGYVSPERTTLIASTHRIYATVEKMQMADGRYDSDKVLAAGKELAKKAVLFDMRKLAQESGRCPLPAIAPKSTALITVPLSCASLRMSNSTALRASCFAAAVTRSLSKRPSAICIFSMVA